MVIAILATDSIKEEWLSKVIPAHVELVWADSMRSLGMIDADVYADLLFEYDPERIGKLKQLLPKPVMINSVIHPVKDTGAPFIRINAWPTMLGRPVTELAFAFPEQEETVGKLFGELGWAYQRVSDTVGMITPRIIAMIINEAWYTLGNGTSTREEIDIAMKLGTNYPMGPFEWGEKIGLINIRLLLQELARTDTRYTIAPLLQQQ